MTPHASPLAIPGRHPIPRSVIAIGLGPELRGRLASMARGRTLLIDFFASRCCGSNLAVGDLTARFVDRAGAGAVELAPVEEVRIAADPHLLELLGSAGPTLRLGGLPFARHLVLDLEDPAAWLDFLATPAACRRG